MTPRLVLGVVAALVAAGCASGLASEPGSESGPCTGVSCTGRGICASPDGAPVCTCEAGSHAAGLECVEDTDACAGVSCSGHGRCSITDGSAACACAAGYHPSGLECLAAADGCSGVTCSGHGSCSTDGGSSACACASGYQASGLECLAAADGYVPPDLPVIPQRTFVVTDHGAVGDGKVDDTQAIQATIAEAVKADGGVVVIPSGSYLSGPLKLASGLELRIESGATLRMLPMDRYPGGSTAPQNFLAGTKLQDVAITGAGTIDGQGADWWPRYKEAGFKRPVMISVLSSRRVLIENLTLKNSPSFHIAVGGEHITVRGVTIRAPPSDDPVTPSHNTDACDVQGQHILIDHCDVSVGDDNFTCGGGTSDVRISNSTYGHGHGVSIGSYTQGGVSDITVTDCTFTDTEAGVRIKSDRDRGGLVRNITYRNLTMTNVGMPIVVYATYMATEAKYRDLNRLTADVATSYPSQPLAAKTPIFDGLQFVNIRATAQPGRRAGLIWGLPEAPATNLSFKDVHITADLPLGIFVAQKVTLSGTQIITPAGVDPVVTGAAQVTVE